jgi:hypothetical protein
MKEGVLPSSPRRFMPTGFAVADSGSSAGGVSTDEMEITSHL